MFNNDSSELVNVNTHGLIFTSITVHKKQTCRLPVAYVLSFSYTVMLVLVKATGIMPTIVPLNHPVY